MENLKDSGARFTDDAVAGVSEAALCAVEQFRAENERELLTILFTDLVEMTKLQSELGNVEAARLNQVHRRIIRAELAKFHAREIEWAGDSCLAVFTKPSDGVAFALRMQAAMRDARQTEPHLSLVRVGLHMGELVVERHAYGPKAEDLYGLQVSEAARVMSLARGNQIFCTRPVYDNALYALKGPGTGDLGRIAWKSHGRFLLKGTDQPVEVCEVGEEGLGPFTAPESNEKCRRVRERSRFRKLALAGAALGGFLASMAIVATVMKTGISGYDLGAASSDAIGSIAVLPFTNMSGDSEQEFFVDGMTEALIAELSKLRALKVISRTSVMQYKKTMKSLPSIAEELHVGALVEGSVVRAGNDVRITAQLINGKTDQHLWADSYNGTLENVLTLQNEVAYSIVREIKVALTPEEERQLTRIRAINAEAQDSYLKGRAAANQFTKEGFLSAIAHYEKAISIQPDYAAAYAWLASAHLHLATWVDEPPADTYPKVKTTAGKAVSLDSSLADPYLMLAIVAYAYEWDWRGAEQLFQKALDRGPHYALAHAHYAWYLSVVGRSEEAISEAKRALELDPFSAETSRALAVAYGGAHQFDRAIEQDLKTLDLDPKYVPALIELGWFYLSNSMEEKALECWGRLASASGRTPYILGCLGAAYAKMGKRDEALRLLEELNTRAQSEYVGRSTVAVLHAYLGDEDEAFALLEQAVDKREWITLWLKSAPSLGPLRSDPRYNGLIRRMGLPE